MRCLDVEIDFWPLNRKRLGGCGWLGSRPSATILVWVFTAPTLFIWHTAWRQGNGMDSMEHNFLCHHAFSISSLLSHSLSMTKHCTLHNEPIQGDCR